VSCKASYTHLRKYRRIAAVIALAVGSNTVLAQQGSTPATHALAPKDSAAVAPSLHVLWSGPSLAAADTARLSATLSRADSMARTDHFADAARLYWSVIVEQRAASEYPADALRRIAMMYFSLDQEYAAADAFMELAESAAQFGDPTTRLRALFDAALMYQRLGRSDRVLDCCLLYNLTLPTKA
jgi:hypothetical protein